LVTATLHRGCAVAANEVFIDEVSDMSIKGGNVEPPTPRPMRKMRKAVEVLACRAQHVALIGQPIPVRLCERRQRACA